MSFLLGTLALIVLQTLLRDNGAKGVEAGGRAGSAILAHALSPQVAGIPQRKSVTEEAKSSGATAGKGALDDFLGGVVGGITGTGPGSTSSRDLFPDKNFSFAPGEPQPRTGP